MSHLGRNSSAISRVCLGHSTLTSHRNTHNAQGVILLQKLLRGVGWSWAGLCIDDVFDRWAGLYTSAVDRACGLVSNDFSTKMKS